VALIIISVSVFYQASELTKSVKQQKRSADALERQIRLQDQHRAKEAHEARQRNTVEFIRSTRTSYQPLVTELRREDALSDSDKQERLRSLFAIFEHMSAGVNFGMHDIHIVNSMLGNYVRADVFEKHALWFRDRRRFEPRIYDQLNILLAQLYDMHESPYVIPPDIASLPDEIEQSTRARLATLAGSEHDSLRAAFSAISATGVGPSFAECAAAVRPRGVIGHIEEYSERDHRGAVVAVLESIRGLQDTESFDLQHPGAQKWPTDEAMKDLVAWFEGLVGDAKFVYVVDGAPVGCIGVRHLARREDDNARFWLQGVGDAVLSSDSRLHGRRIDYHALRCLAVSPGFAGRGIGRSLLRYAIDWVQRLPSRKQAPIAVLNVIVDAPVTQPARRLYASQGGASRGPYKSSTGRSMEFYMF
jgi:GNAT superfamily N-acetyltransferase